MERNTNPRSESCNSLPDPPPQAPPMASDLDNELDSDAVLQFLRETERILELRRTALTERLEDLRSLFFNPNDTSLDSTTDFFSNPHAPDRQMPRGLDSGLGIRLDVDDERAWHSDLPQTDAELGDRIEQHYLEFLNALQNSHPWGDDDVEGDDDEEDGFGLPSERNVLSVNLTSLLPRPMTEEMNSIGDGLDSPRFDSFPNRAALRRPMSPEPDDELDDDALEVESFSRWSRDMHATMDRMLVGGRTRQMTYDAEVYEEPSEVRVGHVGPSGELVFETAASSRFDFASDLSRRVYADREPLIEEPRIPGSGSGMRNGRPQSSRGRGLSNQPQSDAEAIEELRQLERELQIPTLMGLGEADDDDSELDPTDYYRQEHADEERLRHRYPRSYLMAAEHMRQPNTYDNAIERSISARFLNRPASASASASRQSPFLSSFAPRARLMRGSSSRIEEFLLTRRLLDPNGDVCDYSDLEAACGFDVQDGGAELLSRGLDANGEVRVYADGVTKYEEIIEVYQTGGDRPRREARNLPVVITARPAVPCEWHEPGTTICVGR